MTKSYDFSLLGKLRTALRFFVWDLAHNEDRENSVVNKMDKLMEQDHVTAEAALHQLQEERPLLLKEPSLDVWPPDVLFSYTEEIAKKIGKEDLFEVQEEVRKEHPELAQLCDLAETNGTLFNEACRKVGLMPYEMRSEEKVINAILLAAERISDNAKMQEQRTIARFAEDYKKEMAEKLPSIDWMRETAPQAEHPKEFLAAVERFNELLQLRGQAAFDAGPEFAELSVYIDEALNYIYAKQDAKVAKSRVSPTF